MNVLLAQTQESVWPLFLRAAENNGFWIFVGFCVLAGTAKHLVARILDHNERIAMIKAGLRPDDAKNFA